MSLVLAIIIKVFKEFFTIRGRIVTISQTMRIYWNKAKHGAFGFDHSNNNGVFKIGAGDYQ